MLIYPDDDLGLDEWDEPRYVGECERARDIIRNPLNSIVTYRVADVIYMRVTQESSAPWREPVIRNYNVQRNIGEWAIRNYDNTIPMPNSQCPICGNLNTISEYTGANVLNITCQRCVDHGYPDMTTIDTVFSIDWGEPEDSEKVNWALEGF